MFMGGRRGRAAWCLTGARSGLPTVRPAAIHHVSICVPDADAGLAFYRDVIGLTEVAGPDLGPGSWLHAGGQQVQRNRPAVAGDAAGRRVVSRLPWAWRHPSCAVVLLLGSPSDPSTV